MSQDLIWVDSKFHNFLIILIYRRLIYVDANQNKKQYLHFLLCRCILVIHSGEWVSASEWETMYIVIHKCIVKQFYEFWNTSKSKIQRKDICAWIVRRIGKFIFLNIFCNLILTIISGEGKVPSICGKVLQWPLLLLKLNIDS